MVKDEDWWGVEGLCETFPVILGVPKLPPNQPTKKNAVFKNYKAYINIIII